MYNICMDEKELYIKILDQFPNPIWRAGADSKCNFFNKNWLEFTGRTMEQEMGNGWTEDVHPDDLKKCVEDYLAYFNLRKPFKLKYRLKHNDGTYHWLLDFGNPLFDNEQKFLGYVGSCYDINDEERYKEEEETIRKQNLLMTTILEKSPIGFAVNTISDGKVVFVSSKFEEIYGIDKNDIKTIDDFFEKTYLDPVYREKMKKITMDAINSNDTKRMKWDNILITTKTGETKYINALNIPIPEQNLMISTVHDVTKHKLLEEELKNSENELHTKLEEAEKLNKLMVGRELDMVELKNKIAELEEIINTKK